MDERLEKMHKTYEAVLAQGIKNKHDKARRAVFKLFKEAIKDKSFQDMIIKRLPLLTPRGETLLMYRYGLKEPRCHTLEELGERFAVTRERVAQIIMRAIVQLCDPQTEQRRHPWTDAFGEKHKIILG